MDVRCTSLHAPVVVLELAKLFLLFVCVARYHCQKNHRTLIEAFAARPARPSAKLLLGGDGPLREEAFAR